MGIFSRQSYDGQKYDGQMKADQAAWVKAQNAAKDAGKRHGFGSAQHKAADRKATDAARKAKDTHRKRWGK